MALEAFRIHVSNIGFDLPKTDQITSLEIWDSCVYLGTKGGVVHQYVRDDRSQTNSSQNKPQSSTNSPLELLDAASSSPISPESFQPMSRVTVSKKTIQAIKSIPQLNLLLIHTDAKIIFHDLRTLKKLPNKPEIYYVGLFTIDPSTFQLCMSVKGKRKLYFYGYNNATEKYEYSKELFVPEIPLSITWVNNRICIGIQGNYVLINPPDGKTFPLSFMIDHLPLMTAVGQQEVCVFTSEVGINIMSTGDPSQRPPVVFSSRPQAICTLDQYLVGVSDGVLEVVSTYDSKVIQCPSLDMLTHDYPEYKLPISPPTEPIQPGADISAPMIASHQNNVVVYLPQQSHIVILHAVPVEFQIKQYLNKLMMDEALALLLAKGPSQREIEAFHIDAGLELIIALQFHRAFQHFAISNIEPSQLLSSLFPHILTLPKSAHIDDQALFNRSLHSLIHDPLSSTSNSASVSPSNTTPTSTTLSSTKLAQNTSYSIHITHPSLQKVSLLNLLTHGRKKYISRIKLEDFQDIDQLTPGEFHYNKDDTPSHFPFALSYTALYSLLLWYLMLFLQLQRNHYTQLLSKHQKASLLQSRQKSQGYVMSDDYFQTQQLDQHNRANILSPQKLTHTKQELTYIDNALLYLTVIFTAVFNPHFHLNFHNAYTVHTFSLLEYMFPFLEADGYTPEQWYRKTQHFYDTSLDLFHYNADILERQKQQQYQLQQQLLLVGSTTATTSVSNNANSNSNANPNSSSSTSLSSSSSTSQSTPAHPIPFALYLAQQALTLIPKKTRSMLTFIQPQNNRPAVPSDPSSATRSRKRNHEGDDDEGKKTNCHHDDPNLHIATPLDGFRHIKLQAYPLSNNTRTQGSPTPSFESSSHEHHDQDSSPAGNINGTSTRRRRERERERALAAEKDLNLNDDETTTILGRALSGQSTNAPTTTTTTTTISTSTSSSNTTTSNLSIKKYLSYFPISIQSLLSTQYCTPIYFIILLSFYEQWYGLAFFYLQRHILSQQHFYPANLKPTIQTDEIPLNHPSTLYWLDKTSPLCHALQIYYRLSIPYAGPICTQQVIAPNIDHHGVSYQEFTILKTKLIKSTIDIFEYEETNNFIPNFYLCRRTSPPVGFMAHVLRYQSSKDLPANQMKMRKVSVHFVDNVDDNGDEHDDLHDDDDDDDDHDDDDDDHDVGRHLDDMYESNVQNHHNLDDIDDTIHSSDDDNGIGNNDDENTHLGLPNLSPPHVSNHDYDDFGRKITPFNLNESTTQQATLFVPEIANNQIVFAYFPQEQHTSLTSSTYRKALGQSTEDSHKSRGNSSNAGYASYFKISALKKTANFLYNPFKRRQHWSQNHTKKVRPQTNSGTSGDLSLKDTTSSAVESSITHLNRNNPKSNLMDVITNLSSLDLYNIPNALCPDFFNVQLAFDCYFIQQQQEYPISDILLQYYYYSYYYTPASLLYSIQLLENQPLWELYYRFVDYHTTDAHQTTNTSSASTLTSTSPSTSPASLPKKTTLQQQDDSIGKTPIGTSFLLGPAVADFDPKSNASSTTSFTLTASSTQQPACLNIFPPLPILNAYLPWITAIAPTLIIPLLSSMWLTLLVEYHSSLAKPLIPTILTEPSLSSHESSPLSQQSTQQRTVPRSKAMASNEQSTRAVASKPISMTMIITPTASNTNSPRNQSSSTTSQGSSTPIELIWLQQLSTAILNVDVQSSLAVNQNSSTPTSLPFSHTNRLLNVYNTLEDLSSTDQTITTCVQSQKNHLKVVEKQTQLLSQIIQYDRITPPLFILLLVYVLHSMNSLPNQSSFTTTPSIAMIFSLLFPSQAQTTPPTNESISTNADPSYIATSDHKMIDTLLLMLIKQLRQIELHLKQVDTIGVATQQSHSLTALDATSRIISNIQVNSINTTNTEDPTPRLYAIDPTLYVTRLNNMIIQKNDYTTLLNLLQNSFVTTITDIIHSATFYQELTTTTTTSTSLPTSTSSLPYSTRSAASPGSGTTTQTQTSFPAIPSYITHSYAPSVEVILDAIRGSQYQQQQQQSLSVSSSHSSQNQPPSNSLSHCCLTLEARLGHHTDVINLYMFTLEDIDGALSYIRVVNEQQNQTSAESISTNSNNVPQKDDQQAVVPIFILFLQIVLSKQYQNHMVAKQLPMGTLIDPNNAPATWLDVIMYIFQTHSLYFIPHLARVLTILPPNLPISTILPLFEQTLPQLNHQYDTNAITTNFTKRSYITNKLQLFTLRKGYVVLHELAEPSQKTAAGNRNRQMVPTKPTLSQSQDQVCVICNKILLEGTVVASLPFKSMLYLISHYPDIFSINSQGQKDPALPAPTTRNGIADLYGNNIMCHYNCTQRIQQYFNLAKQQTKPFSK